MEVGLRRSNKRKACEVEGSGFALNELNQDVLERVLSWLPTSLFFRLSSVCKRWKSVAESATFRRACAEIPSRDPWFFMVDSESNLSQQPIVFDSTEGNWKKLNLLYPAQVNQNQENSFADFIPVAASGGLICFYRESDGGFILSNPVTAACRRVNLPFQNSQPPIRAISMVSKSDSFKLIVVSGELTNLRFRQYDSAADQWGEETQLTRKTHHSTQSTANDNDGDCSTPYFLSKCGNVVSTNIERNPSKQYSSIITLNGGDELLHFLSSSGSVVSCNLTRKSFFEYPRLLPVFSEYSIDLVECKGQMYVLLLSEFLESASVRVWTWDDGVQTWRQAAAMPPWMSQRFYGKEADINCAGAGEGMMMCVKSGDFCSYVMCDLAADEWVELPECCVDGGAREFVCAWSFEPRIEV